MALHAENALGCLCILEVFNLSLAIPAFEAFGTESLVASEDSKILYLILTDSAAVGAIITDEGAIA